MNKKVSIFLASLFISTNIYAIDIKDKAPEKYVVKKNDTLWDISSQFLNSPWKWPELWDKNNYITNPHLIYPGDIITIKRNSIGEKEIFINGLKKPLKRYTLSPKAIEKPKYISTINFKNINTIVNGEIVSDQNKFGSVLGSNYNKQIFGANDNIYIKNQTELEIGDKINIYNKPILLKDKEEEVKFLKYNGYGIINQKTEKPNTYRLHIEKSLEPIYEDDFIYKNNKSYNYSFEFSESKNVNFDTAEITYVFDEKPYIAKNDSFIISKGKIHGVKVGQVFSIYQKGKNIEFPNEFNGYAVVFKTTDKYSFLEVTHSENPIETEENFIKKIGAE